MALAGLWSTVTQRTSDQVDSISQDERGKTGSSLCLIRAKKEGEPTKGKGTIDKAGGSQRERRK